MFDDVLSIRKIQWEILLEKQGKLFIWESLMKVTGMSKLKTGQGRGRYRMY